jgi:hypothetical protein
MAGAKVFVFAFRDYHVRAVCGRFDDRADVRIISDRVVEMVDFRVGVFIGLPRKLASAKELGIGGRSSGSVGGGGGGGGIFARRAA